MNKHPSKINPEVNIVHLKNAIDDLYQDSFYNDAEPYLTEVVNLKIARERLTTIILHVEKAGENLEKLAEQVEYERKLDEEIISLYQSGDRRIAKL